MRQSEIKPMLSVLQDQVRVAGRSAGVLPCALLELCAASLLDCFSLLPSHTFGQVSIPHSGIFLFQCCVVGCGLVAMVTSLLLRGFCTPLLLPLRHLPSCSSSIGLEFNYY